MTTIETERLLLRILDQKDATQQYVDWLNDPEVNQYLETRHSPQTLESCEAFIEECTLDPASFLFGVFLKETGQHIGNVKIGFINDLYKRGQLSLFLGEKSCWGKGYTSEFVRAITRYGFDTLKLHRIEAGIYEDNFAILKVLLKAGYTVEGYFRDHFILDGRRAGCFWLGVLRHEYSI